MLSKTNPSPNEKYCIIPFRWSIENCQTHRHNRMVVSRNWGRRKGVQWIKRVNYMRWRCSRDLSHKMFYIVNNIVYFKFVERVNLMLIFLPPLKKKEGVASQMMGHETIYIFKFLGMYIFKNVYYIYQWHNRQVIKNWLQWWRWKLDWKDQMTMKN